MKEKRSESFKKARGKRDEKITGESNEKGKKEGERKINFTLDKERDS